MNIKLIATMVQLVTYTVRRFTKPEISLVANVQLGLKLTLKPAFAAFVNSKRISKVSTPTDHRSERSQPIETDQNNTETKEHDFTD
jgi:hypothetical protein